MSKKNKYLSETGHLIDEYLNLYIDAHLLNKVTELPLEILDHVEDCQFCKQNILDGYDILKEADGYDAIWHPYFGETKNNRKELKKTNFSVLYKIAASVVFIVSVGIIGFYLLRSDLEIPGEITEVTNKEEIVKDNIENTEKLTSDTLIKIGEKESNEKVIKEEIIEKPELNNLIAENKLEGEEFKVSPIMLAMLGAQTRNDFFELEYPKDSVILEQNKQIEFAWQSDINEEIKLKIFNYKEELVFESKVLKKNEYLLTEILQPGAYIWKIEGTNDMYHLGLFFISK